VWKLKMLEPRMSPGIRSGVNWMRPNSSDRVRAKLWASRVLAVPGGPSSRMWPPQNRAVSIRSTEVLAVPGGPSSRMWPPQNRAVSIRSTVSVWPMTALPTSVRMRAAIAPTSATSTGQLRFPLQQFAHDDHQVVGVAGLFGLRRQGLERGFGALSLGQTVQHGGQGFARQVGRRGYGAARLLAHQFGVGGGHAALAP